MLSKREATIKKITEIEPALLCPICNQSLSWSNNQMQCINHHAFDVAKKGYLNLAPQHLEKYYTQELFEARQKIMGELELYDGLYSLLLNILKKEVENNKQIRMLDLGSGEGSHLQLLYNDWLERFPKNDPLFIGLDIAKEGIQTAAKYYQDPLWLVADLSHIPFDDNSVDGILTILSPSNYEEIQRVLKKKEGWFIKVIPGSNYLKELREIVLPEEEVEYDPSNILSHFKENFSSTYKKETFYQRVPIEKEYLESLIEMTPLTQHIDKKTKEFLFDEVKHITVDLIILFVKNR